LAVVGYWLLFTTFMFYDDEGYVLWSLRNYIAHGGLYSHVYSQYGPFYYEFHDLLRRLIPLEYDNVSGRWITLVNWLLASGAGGILAWRHTRSVVCTLFGTSITFLYLWILVSEPMHPGGLLTSLVMIGAIAGAIAIERKRPMAFAVGAALIGIALVLTKINVGVFFVISAAGWMLIRTCSGSARRLSVGLMAMACVLLPSLLMHSLWPAAAWVRMFAFVVTTSALGLLMLSDKNPRPEYTGKTWTVFFGVALIWAFLICGLCWMRGTDINALIQGVILAPLRQPSVYCPPITWGGGSGALAIGSLGLAAFVYIRDGRLPWIYSAIAVLRLIAGAWFLGYALSHGPLAMPDFVLSYGLPLTWLMVCRLDPGPGTNRDHARLWIGWVLVFQTLHAYPVAGSQLSWGTCLFPAVLVMGLHDALAHLKNRHATAGRWLAVGGGAALLVSAGTMLTDVGKMGAARYRQSQPLGLRGAEQLRLTDSVSDTLHILDANLRLHSGVLFSFPGLYSFNIWTGKPAPTLANATHWFTLLNASQQQAIIEKLEADPRACIVVQQLVLDFLKDKGFSTRSPLQDYLAREFTPALTLDGYAIWTHKNRRIAPINMVNMWQTGPGLRLKIEGVAPVGGQTIARIELHNYEGSPVVIQAFDLNPSSAFSAIPIQPDGQTMTDGAPAVTGGLVRFTLDFKAVFDHHNPKETFVLLKAADGRVLGRLRFPY
jgi:hypothetical protein